MWKRQWQLDWERERKFEGVEAEDVDGPMDEVEEEEDGETPNLRNLMD